MEVADALSTLSFAELVAIASSLGFSTEEVEQRIKHIPQKVLVAELLLEYRKRRPCHVKRRLGQVLLNNGHWKEALKIYPSG